MALLSGEDRRAVAALPSLRDAEVLGTVVRAVVATGLWAEFLPLVAELPTESRKVVADTAGALPDTELDAMVLEVEKQDLWDAVLPLVEIMDEPAKERVFALPAFRGQG